MRILPQTDKICNMKTGNGFPVFSCTMDPYASPSGEPPREGERTFCGAKSGVSHFFEVVTVARLSYYRQKAKFSGTDALPGEDGCTLLCETDPNGDGSSKARDRQQRRRSEMANYCIMRMEKAKDVRSAGARLKHMRRELPCSTLRHQYLCLIGTENGWW